MTLIVPSGSENTITNTYLRQFWSESCGFSGCTRFRLYDSNYPGWHHDVSFTETSYCCGGHGGCSGCIMTLSQMLANYQTEVTFVSNPPGAHIFIDGIEWWPGAETAVDGATFRGISPTTIPVTHSYEMSMQGYLSATGTFELVEGTPITVSGTLYLLTSLGNATIESIPVGAEIWLAPTGQTLVDQEVVTIQGGTIISNLLEGSYDYKLTLTGFQDAIGSFNIIGGQTTMTTITLSEIVPANIIATAITPNVATCTAPCNMTVDITWMNNGGISGTFIPTITINGTPTVLPEESLGPNLSTTKTFSLTGLVAGIYSICSQPNTFPCPTVTVVTPASVISATLTVDTNDCITPCTVNGTVSWTNTGGSPGTLDPAILVNTESTSIGSAVQINPGETLQYIFQLPNLIAGTYSVCAYPDSGTACQTIIVRTLADITVTAITPSVTTCAEPCNPTVNITWTNTGGVASTFTPAIVVDGISTPLATPETINPAQFITKTFIVTNLMKGSHTICANPDTGTTCVTITVEQVTQAGFGGAGMVMVAGLAVGALYMATKKPKI